MLRSLADQKFLPALQLLVFLCGILIVYFTDGDRLLFENLPSSWQSHFPFRNAFIVDFTCALGLSVLAWHLLFFRTLFASDQKKPKWHVPLLRLIDYAWYMGSAYAALLVVAVFQGQFALKSLESIREQEVYLHGRLVDQFEELATNCLDLLSPVTDAASDDLRNAYKLVTAVCAYENAKVDKEGPFYDMTIGRDCQDIAAARRSRMSFRAPPEHASYALDLQLRGDILDSYEHIRSLCLTQIDLAEITTAKEISESMIGKSSLWSQEGHEPGHFRWIALLIGLRLVRTTFEVIESVKKVRGAA